MSALQDIRIALRLLRRSPGVTGIALLSIALSVGATSVVFTAIKSVLLQRLPYEHPERLVQLRTDIAGAQRSQGGWVSGDDAYQVIRRQRTLESIGVYGNVVFDLAAEAGAPPEALYGIRISPSLLPTLGATPMLGRNILPEEDEPGHPLVMILSYGFWTRRFNGDRGVVGKVVNVNGRGCRIVGVMPPGFDFPLRREATHTPPRYVEFWSVLRRLDPTNDHGGLSVVARLRPGVTRSQAAADLDSISAQLARQFPEIDRGT